MMGKRDVYDVALEEVSYKRIREFAKDFLKRKRVDMADYIVRVSDVVRNYSKGLSVNQLKERNNSKTREYNEQKKELELFRIWDDGFDEFFQRALSGRKVSYVDLSKLVDGVLNE